MTAEDALSSLPTVVCLRLHLDPQRDHPTAAFHPRKALVWVANVDRAVQPGVFAASAPYPKRFMRSRQPAKALEV